MNKNDKIVAFTLAETLITLVIIGVVAALTVPTMMHKRTNEESRAKLLKAQSVLTNALTMNYMKDGVRITPNEFFGGVPIRDKILPLFALAKDCGQTYGTNKPKGCYTGNTDKNSYVTYNKRTNITPVILDDGQFILNDGILVMIEDPYASASGDIYFTVDLNGFNKKPNRAGYDLFTFQLNSKGYLVPMGAKGTAMEDSNTFCSSSSTNDRNGCGCTLKAISDKNYFNNL